MSTPPIRRPSSTSRRAGVVPPPTGKPGRPKAPLQVPLPELHYATVHKTREKGRVVKIAYKVVFGVVAAVMAAVSASRVSRHINTAFIERHNGTDRNRNSRKVRKTYCFSKDWDTHEAVGYFTMYSYPGAPGLAGADASRGQRGRSMEGAYAGDGRGAGRSHVVAGRMAVPVPPTPSRLGFFDLAECAGTPAAPGGSPSGLG